MRIRKPVACDILSKNPLKTIAHFENGGQEMFYFRCALSWPEGDGEGFALVAGLRIRDGLIFIFDQARFWTLSPWKNGQGSVRTRDDGTFEFGLVQTMLDWYSLYKCATYFYGGQHVDLHRRYVNELYSHKLFPERFESVEVPYVREVGDQLIDEKIKTSRFLIEKDTLLGSSLEQWMNLRASGSGDNNRINCLRIILAGYDYQPYIDYGVAI